MKSQSSLLIAVGILAFVIFFMIFNLFTEVKIKERITRSIFLDMISKYLDFLKGFLRTSLIYSSHLASNGVAFFGGVGPSLRPVEPRTWICNGPTPPEPLEIKFWLNNETLQILNNYTRLFNFQKDLFILNASPFSCLNYEVEDSKIFSGEYDEGFFNISAEGCRVNVSSISTPDFATSLSNLRVLLPQNRIWYLYRKFYEWAQEEGKALPSRICGCIELICNCPGLGVCKTDCPALYQCIDNNFNISKEILQSKFDEYVKCTYTIHCCEFESQFKFPCEENPNCLNWETERCEGCYMPPYGDSCKVSFSPTFSTFKFLTQEECKQKKCEYWQENREVVYGIFECTDEKYYLSLKDGTGPMTFRVSVRISLRKPYSCYTSKPCEMKNNECVCPLTAWCRPCE
jgi:hypothetical protein